MWRKLPARLVRKIWTSTLGVDSWIDQWGDFRTRERYGRIARPNYLYGMLRAADCAKYFGKQSVTVIEMGVASGAGLMNMIELAAQVQRETGVRFKIFGFDTGAGLPYVEGFKDHPEIWNPGDFVMEDRDVLLRKISGQAEIIWGDVNATIDEFVSRLDAASPLGFISVDVDLYSATKSALRCLAGAPEKYNPAISMYFDDVSFFFANRWCGELAAISEFNQEHDLRKIDLDRSLVGGQRPEPSQPWYSSMYVCHVLDHPARQSSKNRPELTISQHTDFMASRFLF